VFSGYKKTAIYRNALLNSKNNLKQVERLQQVQDIQVLNYNFSNYSKTKTYIDKVFNNEEVFKKGIDNGNGRKIIHPPTNQSFDVYCRYS